MRKKNITIRDNLKLDFESELKHDLTTKEKQDDSYQFMLYNLEQRWNEKRKNDRSLTKRDIAYIKTVLNDRDYTLEQAYDRIAWFLGGEKCIKTLEEREKWFLARLNESSCIYLMRAIDLLYEATKQNHVDIATKLGMCNSEALDFLDAYKDEDGWVDEKYN